MTRRFFSGSSLQQAVMRAARHYAIDPDEIGYQELNKRHGFLRIRRKVVIEIDPENPKRPSPVAAAAPEAPAAPKAPASPKSTADPKTAATPKAEESSGTEPAEPQVAAVAAEESTSSGSRTPGPATPQGESAETVATAPVVVPAVTPPSTRQPREGRERGVRPEPRPTEAADDGQLMGLPDRPRSVRERYPEATGATALAAEKALQVALRVLDMEAQIDVRQGETRLEIELTTEDQSRLLSDDGRVLAALQHLVPRLIRGFIGESVMCRLDCDNYHQIREEQLRDMAQRAADEVKRRGRPYSLKPMPPEERRVVHLTLEDDSTVKTDSVGDGFFKRVRVRPA